MEKELVSKRIKIIMMGSGKMISEKEEENIFGLTKISILEIGNRTKEMDMVRYFYFIGEYFWKNGNVFDGQWSNDKRNGLGLKKWLNGD